MTGLDCGRVNSDRSDEIVVCTYTGWVFALSTEPIPEQMESNSAAQIEVKVQQLKYVFT